MTPPLVFAHRGSPDPPVVPENTIAAFARARDLRADGIELDVRRTSDGRLVVFHDHEVNGRRLASLTHAELNEAARADVPTFEQALEWAHQTKMQLDVELKEDGYVADLAPLLAASAETQIVTSFSDQILRQLADARTGLLIALTTRMAVTRARNCGASALVVQAKLVDDRLVEELDAAGLDLLVWDFQAERHAQLLSGVRALITDDVPEALELIASCKVPEFGQPAHCWKFQPKMSENGPRRE